MNPSSLLPVAVKYYWREEKKKNNLILNEKKKRKDIFALKELKKEKPKMISKKYVEFSFSVSSHIFFVCFSKS